MVNPTTKNDAPLKADLPSSPDRARLIEIFANPPHWLIALLVGILTVVLLTVTSPDIGLVWDEPIYMEASESYMRWFGELFSHPAQALGDQAIRQYWEYNNTSPPFDEIWSGFFWWTTQGFFDNITAHRFGNILLSGMLVSLVYLLVAEQYGNAAGLPAAAALLTMPRFFFHMHVAALDVPVVAMAFLVCFVFWKTLDRDSFKWTILLGILLGLTISTKINGLVELPIVLAGWVIIFKRRWATFFRLIAMGVIGLVISLVIWPWLYYDTAQRILEYLKFMTVNHYQIAQWYRGYMYLPPPWHYPFVIILLVLPLSIIVLAALGTLRVVSKSLSRRGFLNHRLGWLFIFMAAFPILLVAMRILKAYDDERLLIPTFPFIAAIAGIGFDRGYHAFRHIATSWRPLWIKNMVVFLFIAMSFVPQLIASSWVYPHLLSYYSGDIGLLSGAFQAGFERTYWAETYASALPYLNSHAKPGSVVWVEAHDVMLYYQHIGKLRKDLQIASNRGSEGIVEGVQGVSTSITNADYAVVEFRESGLNQEVRDWVSKRKALYGVAYRNIPLMSIYSR